MRLERSQLSGESKEANEWWQIKRRSLRNLEKAEGSSELIPYLHRKGFSVLQHIN